jgi:hypothetical protein
MYKDTERGGAARYLSPGEFLENKSKLEGGGNILVQKCNAGNLN